MVKRQCLKCYALFDRKSHYNYHINRKFDCTPNNNQSTENTNTNVNMNDELQKNNKTFPCPHCNKNFSTKYTLERHINDI